MFVDTLKTDNIFLPSLDGYETGHEIYETDFDAAKHIP